MHKSLIFDSAVNYIYGLVFFDVQKSGIVDSVMHWAQYEEERALKRKVGGKTSTSFL